MSVHFNGKKSKDLCFNGNKISEAYYNTGKVYQSAPLFYCYCISDTYYIYSNEKVTNIKSYASYVNTNGGYGPASSTSDLVYYEDITPTRIIENGFVVFLQWIGELTYVYKPEYDLYS